MATYRSALGKMVDMGAIIAANERVRAVGNGKMNARGDIIDSEGRVVKPNTTKINEMYAGTVTNRSAVPRSAIPPAVIPQQAAPVTEAELSITPEELQLQEEMSDDAEVEKIKASEVAKTSGRKQK